MHNIIVSRLGLQAQLTNYDSGSAERESFSDN